MYINIFVLIISILWYSNMVECIMFAKCIMLAKCFAKDQVFLSVEKTAEIKKCES